MKKYKDIMEDRNEKLRLFHEMIQIPLGVNDERGKTLHVAFIGLPGSGKSSLINSMITAISRDGRWDEWSPVGFTRDGSHVTPAVIRYPKEKYLWREPEFLEQNYPTFVDVPGLCEDDDEDFQKELLRLVLFGKLRDDDDYREIFKYYRQQCDHYREIFVREEGRDREIIEYGLGMLRERYASRDNRYKVDRVVVVSTCKEDDRLPDKLIDTVKSVCGEESRKIQLFGVLTHRDQAGHSYEERENEFLRALGIPRTRFVSCLCHCDDYAKEVERGLLRGKFPELDVPILEFMTSVCNPTTLILNDRMAYQGHGIGIISKIKAMPTDFIFYHAVIFGLMVLLLSALTLKANIQPFTWDELDNACSELHSLDVEMPFIEKLCATKMLTTLTEPSSHFWPICTCIISFLFILESLYRDVCFGFFKRHILYRHGA